MILLGAVERQAAQVDRLSVHLVAEQERMAGIGGLTLGGSIACSGLGVAAVLVVGTLAVSEGLLNGPTLVMLLLFSAAAFEAAGALPTALQLMPPAKEAIRRIQELADSPPPVPDPRMPAAPPGATGIRFLDVSSAYDPALPVLHGFSLEIPAGGRVALTGPSGAGKSTAMDLLPRFYDVAEGAIRVDGVVAVLGGQLDRRRVAIHKHARLRIEQPNRIGASLEQALEHSPSLLHEPAGCTGSFVPPLDDHGRFHSDTSNGFTANEGNSAVYGGRNPRHGSPAQSPNQSRPACMQVANIKYHILFLT